MPEVLNKPAVEEDPAAVNNNSNTESDNDSDNESIPELEEANNEGADKAADLIPGLGGDDDDAVSRAKQSRGEKKARKMFAKLGLRQVGINARVTLQYWE